ncbi:imidazolonepropionase [Halomarina oriensis]|uniref:Imidazolonepropionase n=1 Tax=Halomarina oriensis TaxID=671145 RepID=A0A6B0GIV7_9EURY|nr:imidazolonepropionase [Halomarina oriensis]MWG34570.1 imidazolonepropionase [Halomarina oriensis]
MSSSTTLVVHDATEVFTSDDDVIENGAVVVEDGKIVAVGRSDEVTREYPAANADRVVDASGKAVLPGFADSHTHALFAGDRSDEFAAKLRGKAYQDILAEGGGILRTVRAVREASDEELLAAMLDRLDAMCAHGTTTVEVKSGYGLDTETELRMLDVLARADDAHPVDVVPTFMGAHAIPEGGDAESYTEQVVDEQLPAVAEQGVAEFCDVFCEEGVFSVEQSRRVLEAGMDHGLTPKVHAEEFVHLGGAQLAADVGATSADHLLHADESDARAVAAAGVVPVFLPGTAFGLGAEYADHEPFVEAGATVAVASDFNPNCYAPSMAFATTLACVGMGMPPAAAVTAATRGGALAMDREDRGTLAPGQRGDLLVVDAPSHVHVPYRFGQNVVETVVKDGRVVAEDEVVQRE